MYMVIVGLSCGHDSAVCVLIDGRLVVNLERERFIRVRHARGITCNFIESALRLANVVISDVDYFAICTTQSIPFETADPNLYFEHNWETAKTIDEKKFNWERYQRIEKENRVYTYSSNDLNKKTLNCEYPIMPDFWRTEKGLDEIEEIDLEILKRDIFAESVGTSFHSPMTTIFRGRKIPTIAVKHQTSHAAAAFYQSPYLSSMVISHDNGPAAPKGPYKGGMVFHGNSNKLQPIWTFPVLSGKVYSSLAWLIGLPGYGGPGKLMGLSAYGHPIDVDPAFYMDGFKGRNLYAPDGSELKASWQYFESFRNVHGSLAGQEARFRDVIGLIGYLLKASQNLGLQTTDDIFSDFGKTIAATAQKIFEKSVLDGYQKIERLFEKLELETEGLCVSGGAALNCPTNTLLAQRQDNDGPFIPPSCDDGGLGIGAALYVYHHLLENPRGYYTSFADNIAFKGYGPPTPVIDKVVNKFSSEFLVSRISNLAETIAQSLANNEIVGVFNGAAETGPRALGNRSILADASVKENWQKVNAIKSREFWRPFAPACLSEKVNEIFEDGPCKSPHMLFNYKVKVSKFPAITHVDKTARVQTVEPNSGNLREILQSYFSKTGKPLLLNTSLNGPGEPILNTPENCINFIRKSDIDAIFIGKYKISRGKYSNY